MSADSNQPLDTAILADLFGSDVEVAASSLRHDAADLSLAERELIRGVVRKRELEFATGRVLARQLLARFEYPEFDLLRDADRVPLWPANLVGSISHSADGNAGLCIVAVASDRDRTGLGVDVEPDLPVKEALVETLCRPREKRWVSAEGPSEIGRRVRIVFSVKEAVYKAFYPTTRVFWGFQDVEVFVDLENASFRADLPPSAGRAQVDGRIVRHGGWILSAVDYR